MAYWPTVSMVKQKILLARCPKRHDSIYQQGASRKVRKGPIAHWQISMLNNSAVTQRVYGRAVFWSVAALQMANVLRACLKKIVLDVIQALDVNARAKGPDGQDHPLAMARA